MMRIYHPGMMNACIEDNLITGIRAWREEIMGAGGDNDGEKNPNDEPQPFLREIYPKMNPCPVCSQPAEGPGSEGVRRPIPDLADGGKFITLTAVPEPGTLSLLGLAFGGYVFRRLCKRRAA